MVGRKSFGMNPTFNYSILNRGGLLISRVSQGFEGWRANLEARQCGWQGFHGTLIAQIGGTLIPWSHSCMQASPGRDSLAGTLRWLCRPTSPQEQWKEVHVMTDTTLIVHENILKIIKLPRVSILSLPRTRSCGKVWHFPETLDSQKFRGCRFHFTICQVGIGNRWMDTWMEFLMLWMDGIFNVMMLEMDHISNSFVRLILHISHTNPSTCIFRLFDTPTVVHACLTIFCIFSHPHYCL